MITSFIDRRSFKAALRAVSPTQIKLFVVLEPIVMLSGKSVQEEKNVLLDAARLCTDL